MCFWEFPVEDTGMYCEFEDELIANMVKQGPAKLGKWGVPTHTMESENKSCLERKQDISIKKSQTT